MLHRPSKAVMAPIAEAVGTLAGTLTQPFISRDVGYVQDDPGQKSRKVRNHMLKSPFKSMLARTAIFALVLALAISFFTVGLAPSATAQTMNDDPCKADTNADPVTVACSYDENDDASVANFSGMDPEGEMIVWSLAGPDAADFNITGGDLTFNKSPNYESPTDRVWDENNDDTIGADEGNNDNIYQVDVVATEVREPGSLDLAQSTAIRLTITVNNMDEDATLTLNRLQVRAPSADGTDAGSAVGVVFSDPDDRDAAGETVTITPTYRWYVPKVSRPELENDDHWNLAGNAAARETATYTPAAGDAGEYLRVVATYTDQAGDPDEAYARSIYPVGVSRSTEDNNAPLFPDGTPSGFTVREDAAVGTVVGTVTGSDVDSIDVLTHALTGTDEDDGLFKINPVTGQITVGMKLDFETATDRNGDDADGKQYRVTVSVYDSLAEVPPTREIDITVTDVNDAPANAAETDPTRMVAENHDLETDADAEPATTATVLGVYTVIDETDEDEGDNIAAITLSLGGVDGGLFSLTDTDAKGGTADNNVYELGFRKSPNYESPGDADGNNRYHVTVITTDNEGASKSRALVIEVTNIDEPGKVTLSTTQPAVGQVITAMLTDPDMKVTEVKWQWERSELPTTGFVDIRGETSDTYTPKMTVEDDPVTTEKEGVDGDEGKYLRVTVLYLDNASARDAINGTPDVTTDDPEDVDTTANDESKGERLIEQPSANAVREAPDVNQEPEFESGITREVREDAGDGGNVGKPVTANDPDAGDELAYSISGGADMAAFAIDSTSGQITVKKGSTLDFEGTQTTFMVEVTARDPFGKSATTMVTIMVTDANEAPELTAPGDPCKQDATTKAVTCDYDENGMDPVGAFTGMDPEGEMIVWSLSGDDAADFDITGGELTFSKSPNYESPADANTDNVYMVNVIATEVRTPGSLDLAQDATIPVTITVKNVDEDASLTFDRLQVRAPNVGGTVAGNAISAVFSDPDTRAADGTVTPITPTYAWFVPKVNRPDLENEDHWRAGLGAATDNSYTPAAGDADEYLRVVATYTDQAGDPDKAYARTVYPVGVSRSADDNNAPLFPDGTPSSFTVREDATVGTVVGTVTGSDVDSNDVLTHALTGTGQDDGLFKIDQATGRITVGMKLDFETADDNDRDTNEEGIQYRVTVTVYDSLAETPLPTRDIDITVTDVNDAPNNADQGTTTVLTEVAENHPVEDDDTADPAEEATVLRTYTVAPVTDEDEGDGIAAITLSLGGVDGDLFSLTDEDGDNAAVTADDNTYELRFRESPNYESPADADGNNKYHVTVITADNEGASSSRPLVIEVTNVDEDGKVMLSTTQPAVGQAITATLTDPDMKVTEVKWQWERSELPTTGFIDIRGATSDTYTPVMTVKDDPVTSENETVDGDEGKYLRVTVTYLDNASARDAINGTPDVTTDDPEDVAATVNDESKGERIIEKPSDKAVREAPDVNQEPEFESGITREVREDAGDGGNVGKPVTANDPDGDALTYSISGGADMGAFAIDSTSGQITVKKGSTLNFEGSQTTFVVEVTARDPFGKSDSTTVTIMVTNDNEPPEVMLIGGETTTPSAGVVGGLRSVYVEEGTTTVGPYVTTIENPSSWTLSGPDAGDFSISSGGDLSFRSAPDYEAPTDANTDNVYMVTVMANNGNGGAELDVTVTVTNDTADDATTTPGAFDPWSYDADDSGTIEKPEMISAINAYLFGGTIEKSEMIQVINLYLFGS